MVSWEIFKVFTRTDKFLRVIDKTWETFFSTQKVFLARSSQNQPPPLPPFPPFSSPSYCQAKRLPARKSSIMNKAYSLSGSAGSHIGPAVKKLLLWSLSFVLFAATLAFMISDSEN